MTTRAKVIGKRGARLRAAASLASPEVVDLERGQLVDVLETTEIEGRARWRVKATDVEGWGSASMFAEVSADEVSTDAVAEGSGGTAAGSGDAAAGDDAAAPKQKRLSKARALEIARKHAAARLRGEPFQAKHAAKAWAAVGLADLALAEHRRKGDDAASVELEAVIAAADGRQGLWFPSRAERNATALDATTHGVVVRDGAVKRADGAVVGYRTWRFANDLSKVKDADLRNWRPPFDPCLLLMFHGNGEVATDYDRFATIYLRLGVRLCVVDYRGYGWSSNLPTKSSTMLSDASEVLFQIERVKAAASLPPDANVILFGRSMGSIAAAHLAAVAPQVFAGFVFESAIATESGVRHVLETTDKVAAIPPEKPVLIIHGDVDAIVPHEHARRLLEARPASRLLTLHAGHNDLLMGAENGRAYFDAVRMLLRSSVAGDPLGEPRGAPTVDPDAPRPRQGFGALV